jgi:hypothetical protein
MTKLVIKHNKWVIFYILMIISFFLFAFISIGIINIKIPHLPFDTNSSDFAVSKVKALCWFDKFENIALRSVKFENGEYILISKGDLLANPAGSSGYLGVAEGLCNTFQYSRKEVKVKVSDSEWDYRFFFGLVSDANRTFKIVNFDGDWRFVLLK